ncbi:hypothetical protein ACHAXA_000128 [Cyclostephanos tholiformis]|uniref:Uncharacterized protein n=1 Tax=Cyclostephanos tholiformis TaxID=382380 RepID=A0ABD3RY18_9STRA
MSDPRLMQEPRRRPQSEGLHCGESIEREDGIAHVIFRCNLPPQDDATTDENTLEFRCRGPSCGALDSKEDAAELDEEDLSIVDQNFFDLGYSMAGTTGFKVWSGSRFAIEALAWPRDGDCNRLREIQSRFRTGANVIELGSGVGVVGTYLAACGSNVLMTDLPTLVDEAIDFNLARNGRGGEIRSHPQNYGDGNDDDDDESAPSCPGWLGPDVTRVGRGWSAAAPLDWTRPLVEQLTPEASSSVDLVVACDVVFLTSMLNSLLRTVNSIFEESSSNVPSLLLCFQRRDTIDDIGDGAAFTTATGVIEAAERWGWSVDCLAWRLFTVKKETNGIVADDESEVFLFEIRP